MTDTARLEALVRFLYPEDITPTAHRLLTEAINELNTKDT